MEEKTQTPQADEEQPALTERGSMALERKSFVMVGQIRGGRERLTKLIIDFGGRVFDNVRLPPTELKMCAGFSSVELGTNTNERVNVQEKCL